MPTTLYDSFLHDLPVNKLVILKHRVARSETYDALLEGISRITGETCERGNSMGHIRAHWHRLDDGHVNQLLALMKLLFQPDFGDDDA